jgi:hypothetical protein
MWVTVVGAVGHLIAAGVAAIYRAANKDNIASDLLLSNEITTYHQSLHKIKPFPKKLPQQPLSLASEVNKRHGKVTDVSTFKKRNEKRVDFAFTDSQLEREKKKNRINP